MLFINFYRGRIDYHLTLFEKESDHFRKPEYREKTKLVLIGSIRDDQDKEYVEQLRVLIEHLDVKKEVELKINLTFKELKVQLQQATIGLHTMKNEEFAIGSSRTENSFD